MHLYLQYLNNHISAAMSPVSMSTISHSNTSSLKKISVAGDTSEADSKIWKQVQTQPSYTILSRPYTDTGVASIQPSQKSVYLTIPTPAHEKDSALNLVNNIRKSAHLSRAENDDDTDIQFLNDMPWISAKQVIESVSTADTSLTSVSWAMTALDPSVVYAAKEWFKTSSLAKRRTYSHGSISVKTIFKRRERSMKGYHPLCQTVKESLVTYPYM